MVMALTIAVLVAGSVYLVLQRGMVRIAAERATKTEIARLRQLASDELKQT